MSILAALLVILVAAGTASEARARQEAPHWSTGDSWTWTWIDGSSGFTLTWTVREQTSLALDSGNWTVWHVSETLVERSALRNATYEGDLWIRTANLGLAREVMQTERGTVAAIWDPPISQAVFPLDDNAWTGTAQGSLSLPTWVGSERVTVSLNYSGRALPEVNLNVPAGAFRAVPILFSREGATSSVAYYSEAAGNFVLIEEYNSGTVVRTQSLTEYHRAPSADVVIVALGVGAGVVLILAVLLIRRLRPVQSNPPDAAPPRGTEPSSAGESSDVDPVEGERSR